MKLPDNAVGISDILSFRDCARRFEFQMRRHTEGSDPPEDQHPDTMYGKAIHEAISAMEEEVLTVDEAVQRAFELFPRWLDPDDLEKLAEDLDTYQERDESGVVLVANEAEIRVPLMEWEGETIYFRGRIDRLYSLAGNPGVFIHRDYKSSKWRKSEAEVHSDLQLWAYNWGIHEFWPECERLRQVYDQLRYGEIPTSKSAAQREQMREWLVKQVTAILTDEELEPTANQWCPWCPIMESCSEVRRMGEWAATRVAELAGDSGKIEAAEIDPGDIEEYVADLDQLTLAGKMIERYEESVKGLIRELPMSRREELGFTTTERRSDYFTPEALAAVHGQVGDLFYEIASLTKSRVGERVQDKDTRDLILGMASRAKGNPTLKRKT